MTSILNLFDGFDTRNSERGFITHLALDAFQDYIILGDTRNYGCLSEILSICTPIRIACILERYRCLTSHKAPYTYTDGQGQFILISVAELIDNNKKVYI